MGKILVVDNNEHIVRMFQEVLTRAGHDVVTAESGKTAMELINNNNFAAAFIDLGLDDTNGLNILLYLGNVSPNTVSIVISGKSDIKNAVEAIKAGVFHYLKKPFDVDDITNVAAMAIQENRRRKYKLIEGVRKIAKDDIVKLSADLLILLVALFSGFMIQQRVYQIQHTPLAYSAKEISYLLLSFAFCYSFIYCSGFGYYLRENSAKYTHKLISLASVYVLYAAIIFFVTDFIYGRLAIMTGYILGAGGLAIGRDILIAKIKQLLSIKKGSGRSMITIRRPAEQGVPELSNAEDLQSHPMEEEKRKIVELTVTNFDKKSVSPNPSGDDREIGEDWGSRLIREFRESRLKHLSSKNK